MTEEIYYKISGFSAAMIDQLFNNKHKGPITEFKDFNGIITELEYHKAKALIAIRLGNKQAAKEYIADTANFLLALGNMLGLYDESFCDSDKSFEINKEVEVFVKVDSPSLNQKIN